MRSKDGLVSYYGSPADLAEHPNFDAPDYYNFDPAVIRKPKIAGTDPDRIFAWELTLTKVATFGFLEETLGKAIFVIEGTRTVSDDKLEEAGKVPRNNQEGA